MHVPEDEPMEQGRRYSRFGKTAARVGGRTRITILQSVRKVRAVEGLLQLAWGPVGLIPAC